MAVIERKLAGLALAWLLLLAACGELPSPTTVPAAPVQVTPTPPQAMLAATTAALSPTQALPAATPNPTATAPSVQGMQATNGPKLPEISPNTSSSGTPVDGIIEAKATRGTLWIKLPALKYSGPNAGWPSWPLGDYKFYYRPSGTNTDQLLKTFPAIAEPSTPPCQTCQFYNYLEVMAPAADNHFLVGMRVMTPNAQNGATLEYWWFEPETQTVKLLLTGPEEVGGGRFSTEALNTDWLFYNEWHSATDPNNPYASEDAHAFLVNLATGVKKEVQLGDENVANHPAWRYTDKLLFAVKDANGNLNDRVLNPQTGVVSPG